MYIHGFNESLTGTTTALAAVIGYAMTMASARSKPSSEARRMLDHLKALDAKRLTLQAELLAAMEGAGGEDGVDGLVAVLDHPEEWGKCLEDTRQIAVRLVSLLREMTAAEPDPAKRSKCRRSLAKIDEQIKTELSARKVATISAEMLELRKSIEDGIDLCISQQLDELEVSDPAEPKFETWGELAKFVRADMMRAGTHELGVNE